MCFENDDWLACTHELGAFGLFRSGSELGLRYDAGPSNRSCKTFSNVIDVYVNLSSQISICSGIGVNYAEKQGF